MGKKAETGWLILLKYLKLKFVIQTSYIVAFHFGKRLSHFNNFFLVKFIFLRIITMYIILHVLKFLHD